MKAECGADFSIYHDRIYPHPVCPKCEEIIVKGKDGTYGCVNCGEKAELDEDMIEWFNERNGLRVEMETCFSCGAKKAMETHYRIDKCTLEWRVTGGKCTKCGCRVIV